MVPCVLSGTMPSTRRLPHTDLDVFRVCLGGNVFSWTANEEESCAVLDAYASGGGNFIDTADVYASWVPGHVGGESEAIIGRWMASRGLRNRMIVATKVGLLSGLEGLAPTTIRRAAEASLRRLGVDRIDLYYAHKDDPKTPLEETLARIRRARPRRQGALRGRLQLHGAAAGRGARDLRHGPAWLASSRCSRTTTSCTGASTRVSSRPCAGASRWPACRIIRWRRGFSRASTGPAPRWRVPGPTRLVRISTSEACTC